MDISFQHTCGKLMWKTSAQWSDSKFSTVFIHISRLLKNDFNMIKTKILIKFGFPQSVNIFPSSYLIVFPMYQHSVCIEEQGEKILFHISCKPYNYYFYIPKYSIFIARDARREIDRAKVDGSKRKM